MAIAPSPTVSQIIGRFITGSSSLGLTQMTLRRRSPGTAVRSSYACRNGSRGFADRHDVRRSLQSL
jgi:hypothetical protein